MIYVLIHKFVYYSRSIHSNFKTCFLILFLIALLISCYLHFELIILSVILILIVFYCFLQENVELSKKKKTKIDVYIYNIRFSILIVCFYLKFYVVGKLSHDKSKLYDYIYKYIRYMYI
jgi:hypothetical protein